MGRPRKFDSEAVLNVALRHFWSSGYTAAKLDDICQEAGITKPSLYNAFGDKSNLYTAALGYYEKAFQARVMQALNAAGTAEEALEQYFDQTASILADPAFPNGCLRVKTLSECATSHPELIKVACTQRDASINALVAVLVIRLLW
ncbi:transcriptional regulator, TetR family protein [Synechococcus sp. PCC 7335]|uniref:TetR/AcrR family transcriptional regulator n=1 Tax=Synechococcus sp. (strain ATCC 29403 / PCC 7335) TaxID=91464 RepID=UPI00017EC091|nr:TetR/AcrR family transcriptional regulator [Synechococcus sp. PCC 7335]EDX83125.1 transcriptional regulator, TetR family protein [Synechococcus sp. PCC 7335]